MDADLNPEKLARSIRTLRVFIDRSLGLEEKDVQVKGFLLNQALLQASACNTYVETVSDKADRLYARANETKHYMMTMAYLDAIKAMAQHFSFQDKNVMLAFDYTDEDFYGDVQGIFIHGVKPEHGVTGAFRFLTCSIVSDDMQQKIPLVSVPVMLCHSKAKAVCFCLALVRKLFKSIALILFDRGFYSKELMYTLTEADYPYLILVPKNDQVKAELESMNRGGRKKILYDFEFSKNKTTVRGQTYQAFLKDVFNKHLDRDIDWVFATSVQEIELDEIISTYRKRWRIETGFRVQDEAKIKCKSTEMNIRFFLFLYEQLMQTLWTCFFKEDASFKSFMIQMSKRCDEIVAKADKN